MSSLIKKDDIQKIISSGDLTIVCIDPDIRTEISKKLIDGIVVDMKKHLLRKKKVYIVMVKE